MFTDVDGEISHFGAQIASSDLNGGIRDFKETRSYRVDVGGVGVCVGIREVTKVVDSE